MKILALDFSSPQRSVAVLVTDAAHGVMATSEVSESSPGHSIKPLAMVEQALQQVGLEREAIECLAVGLGPGSYTGIRAGLALAQGWQLARDVKLLGISSAEAIATQARDTGLRGSASVVIDAQRGEFYLANYELSETHVREVVPLRIVSRETVQALAHTILIGPEVTKWFPEGQIVFPQAAVLAQLAVHRTDFLPGEKLEPIYLRETTFVKAPPPRELPAL
jgi:tRNA threonylcarbamoyl adenosine modification protein YeaZ